jgi:hypothetical protein
VVTLFTCSALRRYVGPFGRHEMSCALRRELLRTLWKSYTMLVWIKGALSGGDSVHMLGLAPICWAIWKTRNVMCFEKRIVKNPMEILYYACVFM